LITGAIMLVSSNILKKMLFITSILKMVNVFYNSRKHNLTKTNYFTILNHLHEVNHLPKINHVHEVNHLPKPHGFSSMPLQSGIFTVNRKIIIGLASSLITAIMGYVVRLILMKYFQYDVFTNLDN